MSHGGHIARTLENGHAESGVSPRGRCGNFVPEPTEPQALQLATVGASLPQWVAEIPAG